MDYLKLPQIKSLSTELIQKQLIIPYETELKKKEEDEQNLSGATSKLKCLILRKLCLLMNLKSPGVET